MILSKIPSLVEFFGYIFHFQGVAIGPGCCYQDYIEFMNGDNFRKYNVIFVTFIYIYTIGFYNFGYYIIILRNLVKR